MGNEVKRVLVVLVSVVFLAVILSGASMAEEKEVTGGTIKLAHQKESAYPGLAKISFNQAMHAAKEKVRGDVLKMELENENGYLVYGVEIVISDKTIRDVLVDAGNGKVLVVEEDEEDQDGDHDGDREDD